MLPLSKSAASTVIAPTYPHTAASNKRNAPNLPAGWKKSVLNRKVSGVFVPLSRLW
jgi:hypothetical protein